MRGLRVLSTAAVVLALTCAGCSSHHDAPGVDAPGSSLFGSAARAHPRPAPADPDLGSVLERYYQQIEARHWDFAYAMLAPSLRKKFTEEQLMQRYDAWASPQFTVHATGGTSLDVAIAGDARGSPGRALRARERVTLTWNGEEWTIAALAPRKLTRGTR